MACPFQKKVKDIIIFIPYLYIIRYTWLCNMKFELELTSEV